MNAPLHSNLLQQPLRDVSAWAQHFMRSEIPVLGETADTLEALRLNEDAVDANLLGETISGDPLMTLKVMAHVSTHRSSRRVTDAETVTAALVLLGISPFFRTFGPQPTIEERLADLPGALDGLQAVLHRAGRAAKFALGFAVHRMDHDAAVIHQAALLHDFAEMLLWCHAPALALEIAARQQADPSLRSAVVQHEVLNIELADLQQALMRAWRLPELLIRMNDDKHAHTAQVRNVLLAIRLARHSARGWDNAALPDDLADIAQLLNLGLEPTIKLVHQLDD
ncbi:HDOD domain-containing protein [Ideonella sp. BN130291]|uniref:HDOD domain-containing protein n=1 Tax=Ideonella sp. BN130291 TaxID=3112940 RepID=UPI002E259367|nr:HDOD domain-containing protein [Ideonella sp. BN130291]